MPFQNKPSGFSPQSLHLLDVALTRLWLEQVSIGATFTHADPQVKSMLLENKRRLDELGMQRRPIRKPKSEK